MARLGKLEAYEKALADLVLDRCGLVGHSAGSQLGPGPKRSNLVIAFFMRFPPDSSGVGKLEMKLARTLKRILELSLSALVVALFFATSAAHSATRNVVAGQLVGAANVNVGGILYDVEFVEGTCIGVFSGCDSVDDFTFSDLATVNVASQALLDQVFLDGVAGNFDTDPTSTFGCTNATICSAQTPYLPIDIDNVGVGVALNNTAEASDAIADITVLRTADSAVGTGQFSVFAVWTPVAVAVVPAVPGPGLLVLLSLLAIGARTSLGRNTKCVPSLPRR